MILRKIRKMAMRMLLSIFCCLFLSIETIQAQEQIQAAYSQTPGQEQGQGTQPPSICPDPEPLAYNWRKGARERVHSLLTNEMKLKVEDNTDTFPEVPFQVNQYLDNSGDIICQYFCGSSEPFIRINMGKPKMENLENKANKDTQKMEPIQK